MSSLWTNKAYGPMSVVESPDRPCINFKQFIVVFAVHIFLPLDWGPRSSGPWNFFLTSVGPRELRALPL